jgi:hypothetical protein
VLSHRNDDILPVDYLIKIVNEQFEGKLSVEESGFTGLVLAVNSGVSTEGVISEIRKLFSTHYSIDDDNNVLLIKEEETTEIKAEKTDSDDSETKSAEPTAEEKNNNEIEEKSAIESSLELIDKLVGADEYKALAHEISDIAPEFIKNKTFFRIVRTIHTVCILQIFDIQTEYNHGIAVTDTVVFRKRQYCKRFFFFSLKKKQFAGSRIGGADCKINPSHNRRRSVNLVESGSDRVTVNFIQRFHIYVLFSNCH